MSVNSNEDTQNDDFFGDGKNDPTNWKREKCLESVGRWRVYRATKSVTELAVKICYYQQDKKFEDSFKKDLSVFTQLSHDRIVKFYGACFSSFKFHMFLEYTTRETLSKFIENMGNVDEPKASQLCKQILEAVAYMHDMGIFHGDITSDNVLMTDENNIKLADFGLTMKYQEVPCFCSKVPKDIPKFLAPEVFSEKYDKPVDIWSVGCVLIHMLTGEQPYPKLEFLSIMTMQKEGHTPAKNIIVSLSESANRFLEKSLQIDPKKRPSAKLLLMDAFITELNKTSSPSAAKKRKLNVPARSSKRKPPSPRSILPDNVLPLYNILLKNTMRETFFTSINPENILDIFSRYNPSVLAKKDIDFVKVTNQLDGKQKACKLLLDLLATNEGWFQCLLSCLKDPQVNLDALAATFEVQEDAVHNYCSSHLDDYQNIQEPLIFYGGGKSDSTNWQKHEFLGVGNTGTFFHATLKSSKDGMPFAVKEIRLKRRNVRKGYDRNEINTLKHLSHERIIKLYGFSSTDLAMYLFFEYIPCGTLERFINKNGIVNKSKVKVLTKQILEAVAYLHAAGFIHKNINSSIVLMSDVNNVKLAGFSWSMEYCELAQSLTGDCEAMNTRFMAPELLKPDKYYKNIDIWSLGCVVYHMLTGKYPFNTTQTVVQVMYKLSRGSSPLSESSFRFTESAMQFLEKTFEKDPRNRKSAECLLKDTFITEEE